METQSKEFTNLEGQQPPPYGAGGYPQQYPAQPSYPTQAACPSQPQQHGGDKGFYPMQPQPVGGVPPQPYTGYQYPPGAVVVTTTTAQPQPSTPVPCSYIVSLVFAIISCFLGCWILSIPAIVFAAMAVSVHSTDARSAKCHCFVGLGLWIASFVVSIIIVVVVVVMVVNAANANDDWHDPWYYSNK